MSFLSSFFGSSSGSSLANAKSIVDVITDMASLASNPKDIDPLLDDVRHITARLQPGEVLSAPDQAALLKVYVQLEDYLTTREPIRTFTREDLRKRLHGDMRAQIESYMNRKDK